MGVNVSEARGRGRVGWVGSAVRLSRKKGQPATPHPSTRTLHTRPPMHRLVCSRHGYVTGVRPSAAPHPLAGPSPASAVHLPVAAGEPCPSLTHPPKKAKSALEKNLPCWPARPHDSPAATGAGYDAPRHLHVCVTCTFLYAKALTRLTLGDCRGALYVNLCGFVGRPLGLDPSRSWEDKGGCSVWGAGAPRPQF